MYIYISLWGRRQNTYGTAEVNKMVILKFVLVEAACAYMYDGMGLKQTHWVKGGANQPLNELLEQHKGKPNLKWICECMVCTRF